MTREDIIRMAREAGINVEQGFLLRFAGVEDDLERFAALILAAEREKVAAWMVERSYATGHGDTVEDLLKELGSQIDERIAAERNRLWTQDHWTEYERAIAAAEREACIRDCDGVDLVGADDCIAAIRARGETK